MIGQKMQSEITGTAFDGRKLWSSQPQASIQIPHFVSGLYLGKAAEFIAKVTADIGTRNTVVGERILDAVNGR